MAGNKNNGQRPLSPHLGIYKPQITSMLSISHRISGFALFVGAILLGWWLVLNIYGCGSCINNLVFSPVGKIFILAWSAALYYHLLNGVRHLCWDIGKGYEIATVNKTGALVLILALALTAATWVIAI